MKNFILLLFIGVTLLGFGQDTLSGYVNYDKTSTYLLSDGIDTFTVFNYANGEREEKISYSLTKSKGIHERFYPNGKTMWVKEMQGAYANGKAAYFDEKGKRVAEFNYKNDTIIDTLFLSNKKTLLLGKMTYSSVIHGGMMREDGTSNISQSSGNRAHVDMYTVKMDKSAAQQKIYKEFRTANNGEFFLCLEEGDFGFFNKSFPISDVQTNMGTPITTAGMSMHANWNIKSPIKIKKNCYNFINLHYSSVGYAP